MWIVAIVVLLLIWGNLSRKSPNHPLNRVQINPKYPLLSNQSTAGDNFNSGNSIVPGVCEPCGSVGNVPLIPHHVIFPIAPPPPIAIQVKPFPVSTARPVSCQHILSGLFACDAPPIIQRRTGLRVCNNLGQPPNNLSTRTFYGSC